MKMRCVLLSKVVALLITFLLLMVPIVAHTSEGDTWASLDSGLHGMQTVPGIVPFNGDPATFEISAPPEDPNEELTWGTEATINICNDGCTHPGICFMCDNPVWGCIICSQGHYGRYQNVYIRGTATGNVTWEIIDHGVFPRDEIAISFVDANPNEGQPYDRLIIGVHDDLTICRNRIITLEVTRGNVTATVYIVLRACCIGCDTFCPKCEGCFNCTVDPCPCTSSYCENCCSCPNIFKSASPTIVSPGDHVVYTIKVTRGNLDREGFSNIRVIDPLNPLLAFDPSSIDVGGVKYFEYSVVDNELIIYYMVLEYYDENEYVDYVTITFTVRVCNSAPAGEISNTARLQLGEGWYGRSASAKIRVKLQGGLTQVRVTKIWLGDEDHLNQRPDSVTVELRRINQADPVATGVLNDANNWTHTWVGLPVGGGIVYYVVELNVPQGYTSRVVMGIATDGITATVFNTFTPPYGGNGGNGGNGDNNGPVGGGNGTNGGNGDNGGARGPLTGDFASTVPLLATILLSVSGLFGGMSLRRKLKK